MSFNIIQYHSIPYDSCGTYRFAKDVSGGSSTASGSGGSGITAGVSKPAINNGHVQHAIHKVRTRQPVGTYGIKFPFDYKPYHCPALLLFYFLFSPLFSSSTCQPVVRAFTTSELLDEPWSVVTGVCLSSHILPGTCLHFCRALEFGISAFPAFYARPVSSNFVYN